MRLIGHLDDEPAARNFGDWLYVQGIENAVEEDAGHGWAIWIKEEDRLTEATGLLQVFRSNPNDPSYRDAARKAPEKRSAAEKEQEAWEKRLRNRRHLFRPLRSYGFGVLTYGLIALSVVVFFISSFGSKPEAVNGLFMTKITYMEESFSYKPGLPEIRNGQVWRLITPMLVHFHILHILFNMLWLKDLGSMIEARQSTGYLALLIIASAAGSNLAQYVWSGPSFGGMSGVVYALLGYVWMRGKYDPGSGLFLPPATVTFMIIWFFAGVFQLIPGMANMAHGAGLAIGVAWGFLASQRYR